MMRTLLLALTSCLFSILSWAQGDPGSRYVETFSGLAMEEMRRTGVPASIKLAQGILESEMGASPLAQRSNNHFGIKCKSNWTGQTTYHDDDEKGECFRKYDSPEQSYIDHSDFLRNSARYKSLFELDPSDYRAWSFGLKKAGYATHPQYPQRLIRTIEKYDLQQYTLMVMSESGYSDSAYWSKRAGDPKDKTATSESRKDPSASAPEFNKRTEHNGLKAVYVPSGTSLLVLANKFKLPLSKLMEYNDLESDGLLASDQWIYLERKWKEGKNDFYVLGAGENLYAVSQATGVQLSQIMHFNRHLQNADIVPGARICLKEMKVNAGNTLLKDKAILLDIKDNFNQWVAASFLHTSMPSINNYNGRPFPAGQLLIHSKPL